MSLPLRCSRLQFLRSFVLCLVLFGMSARARATITNGGSAAPLINTPGNATVGAVEVGISGNGQLFVDTGSILTSTTGALGIQANGIGTASLVAGSWNMSGALSVGVVGFGDMSVMNSSVTASSVAVGAQQGSVGQLSFIGNSSLSAPAGVVVGGAGSGTLSMNVSSPFLPTVTVPTLTLGNVATGTGTVSLIGLPGNPTILNVTGALTVGLQGTGTVNIGNGGNTARLNTASATIGAQNANDATVRGQVNLAATSIWTNTGALVVGGTGKSILNVAGSSTVNTATLEIGQATTSASTMTISGASTMANSGLATLGTNAGGRGSATISGANSKWTSGGAIEVGRGGHGILTVQSDGDVTSPSAVIGRNIGSTGTATVSGAGSRWTLTGDLDLGGSPTGGGGTGNLSVQSDGEVSTGGTLRIWPSGHANLLGGTLSANTIQHNSGSGTLSIGGGTLNVNTIQHTASGAFTMTGGTANVATINYAPGGEFLLQGGTMHVGTFNGNMNNTGGTLSPGMSAGTTNVTGYYTQSAFGILDMELASASSFDKFVVSGAFNVGGTLKLSLINGFNPVAGDSFDLIDAGSMSGTFAAFQLPTITAGLTWDFSKLYTHGIISIDGPGVLGDYNGNGIVDAADYSVWRDRLGSASSLPNDDTAGVGVDDYNRWKTNFGLTAGAGSGAGATASASAVPEPASLLLVATAVLLVPVAGRVRSPIRPMRSRCARRQTSIRGH